ERCDGLPIALHQTQQWDHEEARRDLGAYRVSGQTEDQRVTMASYRKRLARSHSHLPKLSDDASLRHRLTHNVVVPDANASHSDHQVAAVESIGEQSSKGRQLVGAERAQADDRARHLAQA